MADNSEETLSPEQQVEEAMVDAEQAELEEIIEDSDSMLSGEIQCPRCGFINDPGRGACVMCMNYLSPMEGPQISPQATIVPSREELVDVVLVAVEELGVGIGAEEEYAEIADEEGFESIGEEVEEEAAKPPSDEAVPEAAIPGAVIDDEELAEPEPIGTEVPSEEEVGAAGPREAVELDEEDFAPPPPPPGVVEPDEEDFAPPPPPPGVVEPEEEEEFAPPPPPPGVEEEDEEGFAPPPPPGAPVEDSTEESEEEPEEEGGALADWELEFEEPDEPPEQSDNE